MKAEPAAQQALLNLQEQDSALAQLAHRRKTLPELAEIATVNERVRVLNAERVEVDTRVSDLTRQQKKADAEVELVRARRDRDEERLNSGAITNPKDLTSLQSELEALARRIGTLEDEELEVMEALEVAQSELATVTASLTAENDIVAELTAKVEAASTTINAEATDLKAVREQVLPKIPEDLLALYEKIRANHAGLGAAALQGMRCGGCHLDINGADLRELKAEPADTVVRCPECSRILVRPEDAAS